VADDANVYFTSYADVWRVPLSGGVPLAIASSQGAPLALALDATSLYWVDDAGGSPGGQVIKLTPK
jgi:hypothetical protein